MDDMRHPDEGEIHAWLDGALDPATAAGLEAHVAACPACSAAVAEARGLIAGASRILMALDGVPGGVLPAGSQPAGGAVKDELAARRSEQQKDMQASQRRHIPWYARRHVQVAAGLMLVVGIGGVVVRNDAGSSGKMMIEFESVPAVGAPSVARDAAPASAADVGTAASVGAGAPVLLGPPGPVLVDTSRAANPVAASPQAAPRRAAAREEAIARPDRADAAQDERLRVAADRSTQSSVAAAPPPPNVVPTVAASAAPPPPPAALGAQGFTVGGVAGARQSVPADTAVRRAPESLDQARAAAKTAPAIGVIEGKVIGADNVPIEAANVQVLGVGAAAVTAADGSFRLSVPAGLYSLEARRIGYVASKAEPVQVIVGDTATTSITLRPSALNLSEVTVTGASAARSPFAGACFVLDVNADANTTGMPLLPRRVQFRLSESGDAGDASASADRARRLQRSAPPRIPGAASEPARPLAWMEVADDSVEVTWPTESDVVTLVLRVRGSNVTGTARSSQPTPVWTAGVHGSKVPCAR